MPWYLRHLALKTLWTCELHPSHVAAFNLLTPKHLDLVTLIPRPEGPPRNAKKLGQVEIQIKYERLYQKAIEKVEKVKSHGRKHSLKILRPTLSWWLTTRDRLKLIRPTTLAQASRVGGVNPCWHCYLWSISAWLKWSSDCKIVRSPRLKRP